MDGVSAECQLSELRLLLPKLGCGAIVGNDVARDAELFAKDKVLVIAPRKVACDGDGEDNDDWAIAIFGVIAHPKCPRRAH